MEPKENQCTQVIMYPMGPDYDITIKCESRLTSQIEKILQEYNVQYLVISEKFIIASGLPRELRSQLLNIRGVSLC